jgi:hypothetical protein
MADEKTSAAFWAGTMERESHVIGTALALDAIALLKADHRKVEGLFAKFAAAREGDNKMTVHTILEEEIFYPACKGKIEDDLVREAYVEHDGA